MAEEGPAQSFGRSSSPGTVAGPHAGVGFIGSDCSDKWDGSPDWVGASKQGLLELIEDPGGPRPEGWAGEGPGAFQLNKPPVATPTPYPSVHRA